MSGNSATDRHQSRADRADVVALHTTFGTSVELMRTWYRTQSFPRHTHEYFTLGVMLRGAGTLWYRGFERLTYRGDVVVIPPGEVHTGGLARETEVLSYLAVHVPADVLAACADAQGLRGGRTPDFSSAIIRDHALSAELRRLDGVMRAPDATRSIAPSSDSMLLGRVDRAEADDALSAAIGHLVRRHSDGAPSTDVRAPAHEPDFVRLAREIIEDCYADNAQTSLDALARRAGVTPFHLVRVFTLTVGLSPHRYVVQTRVRRARHFLARGIPSSFVAAMTGFVDQSHLTAQFKRYVGTTPASYQRCVAPGGARRHRALTASPTA
jgi:AraC-like DNA-binding protein/quercetin dioxygenase-like cupin family protein